MARATRSANTTQPPQPPAAAASVGAAAGNGKKKGSVNGLPKKRKRPSNAELDPDLQSDDDDDANGQPSKLHRPDATYPLAEDTSLPRLDADRILNVLDSIDQQGLLDRAYPPDQPSSSKPPQSLRQLLQDAENQTLRTIKNAIELLYPVTAHVRSRNPPAADQQIHFCAVALDLLDQASHHTNDFTSRTSLALQENEHSAYTGTLGNKYALMQKLPSGDYWTSALASDDPQGGLSPKQTRAVAHGQAELVIALPSAPDDYVDQSKPRPTLGGFTTGPLKKPKPKAQTVVPGAPRKATTGSFLDYGFCTSFAPVYDGDAVDIGRDELAAYYDSRTKTRAERIRRIALLQERLQSQLAAAGGDDMEVDETPVPNYASEAQIVVDPALFPPPPSHDPNSDPSIMVFGQALAELERENAVTTLMQRNARALSDLQVLQMHRLRNGSALDPEGAENQTAQQLLDSLELLTTLRPRGEDETAIPPADSVRATQLHLPHTLAVSWRGTLAEGRTATLRDNHTVRVKVAGTAANGASSKAGPATPAPAKGTAPGTPVGYAPYAYPAAMYYPNGQYPSPMPATPTNGSPAPGVGYPYPYYPYPYPYPYTNAPNTKTMAADAARAYYASAGGPQGGAAIPNAAKAGTPTAGPMASMQSSWMAMGYPPAAAPPNGTPGAPAAMALPSHMRPTGKQAAPPSPSPVGR